MALYPLKFKPWFLEKIWGGRKIETVLGKPLPPGKTIGESWELYDFPPGVLPATDRWLSSEVANGPLAGRSLHELVSEFGADLHGDVPLVGPHNQFPILIKFLDASEDLSVQVHPDEKYVGAHAGAYLKNEAWYIVQADPGAHLLKGLLPGTTQAAFAKAIAHGTVESLINAVHVKPGDCHYLPSGTVHALKAGILAAEVQTPSDTTYRLFDFNRVDPSTGRPRALHIEQAMQCIDFSGNPANDALPAPVKSESKSKAHLAECDYFRIEKLHFEPGLSERLTHNELAVWILLEGRMDLGSDVLSSATQLTRGETLLLPCVMKNAWMKTTARCEVLQVTFPARAKNT